MGPGKVGMVDGERRSTADMGERPEYDGGDPVDCDGQMNSHARPRARKKDNGADLGAALRAIYSQTVDEQVPPEMLDLLKRLD